MDTADDVRGTLGALADRLAIEDVLTRYARAVDSREFDVVATCFTPDVDLSRVRGDLGGPDISQGVDVLVAGIKRALAGFSATTHLLGRSEIVLRGNEADAETPALACLCSSTEDKGGRVIVRGIQYSDHFIRQHDRWLIDRRLHRGNWAGIAARTDLAVPPGPTPPWPAGWRE